MAGVDNNNQNLPDRVRQLERRLDALIKGAPLRNASITEGGIRVGGDGYIRSMSWDGTSLEDPGTEGWALGGPEGIAIINTLLLREGIVGNDALANPVAYGSSGKSDTGFAVTTTQTVRAEGGIRVPAGFTRATLLAIATAGATNTTAANDYLYVRAAINGVGGGSVPGRAIAGTWASGFGSAIRTIEGLGGGELLTVSALVNAGAAWAASSANIANCDAVAFFAR